MAKPYSLDLRERILKDYDSGVPVDDLVEHYAVSRSWTYSLIKQRRETNSIAPKIQRHGFKPILEPYEKEVLPLVADHPDATLADLCEMLSKHISVSTATLCDFLRNLKITRKKRLSALPNNIAPMSFKSEKNGKKSKRLSTSKDSFSLTKLGRKRT